MVIFYFPNYGFALLEALFAFLFLVLIFHFTFKMFFKGEDLLIKIYKSGSALTWLIIFGIIYGIRALFETLGWWVQIFRILNNDQLFIALMITIYYFLYKPIVKRFAISESIEDIRSQNFDKFIKVFIVVSGVITIPFLSISILQIPMRNPDIFNLSLFWTLILVFFCVVLTSIINRTFSTEKRMSKDILRNSMIVGGLSAFILWSFQLLVFELYLNRWLGLEIIKQDMRMLIIVVCTLYIIFFFQSLKTRFLPEIKEKSAYKIQELLESELNNQKTIAQIEDEHKEIRFPEGISFKVYLFVLKKLYKSSLEDEIFLENENANKRHILGGLAWGISIIGCITFMVLTYIFSNTIIATLSLSINSSLFMVLGDLAIILLFNRINDKQSRTPKIILEKTVLLGGVITFWVWMALFFVFYTYLYILLSDFFIVTIAYIGGFSFVMFAISSKVVWWYATSLRMWDASLKTSSFVKKKASRVSLIWLLFNIPTRILVNFFIISYSSIWSSFFGVRFNTQSTIQFLIFEFPTTIINILIGIFVVSKVYKKGFKESFTFAIFTQIILLLISLVMHITLGFFQSLLLVYRFDIGDLRIPLIVSAGIFVVSIMATAKVKPAIDIAEKFKEGFRTELTPHEEGIIKASTGFDNHAILDVKDLTTYFYTEEGVVKAVEGVSFKIYEGETLGLVGETGCGKSVTALSILRLVRPPGEIKKGQVIFEGEDLHQKTNDEFLRYRGSKITMIFQDPLNSLNPVYKIGDQISEVYLLHMEDELLIESAKKNTSIYNISRKWSQRMLKDLNIPVPRIIFDRYPHELSGGMRQRVQIAMGLACSPRLLIADEPTTALDVTIQNQILKLMKELKTKYNTSILFITHDLGIISKMCDRVAVMYSGFIVEYGEINKLFRTPYHPYTKGLIASVPVVGKKRERLEVIPGMVPNLIYPPSGCRFHPRCQYCFVACHLFDPQYKELAEISKKKVEASM
ncbi:MAG: ABC transporter ATP-binding protein [Candidatus Hodarchaeales archaeon]|jgi:oligopeptide/dipeptide ABC transporter ATP-binding protein